MRPATPAPNRAGSPPTSQTRNGSARSLLAWVMPVVAGALVLGSCTATNAYEVLLLFDDAYTLAEQHPWKRRYCIAFPVVQIVVLFMAFWGFFTVMFTSPGVVLRDPWASVPVPAGPVAPSRSLLAFYKMEMEKQQRLLPAAPNACSRNSCGTDTPTTGVGLLQLPSFLPSAEAWPTPNKNPVKQRELPQQLRRGGGSHPTKPTAEVPIVRVVVPDAAGSGSSTSPPVVDELEAVPGEETDDVEELRYCRLCGVFKPDYARHCRQCGYCVYHFDHHCPYVNNCIGRNNYRLFISFLLYGFLCGIYIPSTFVALFVVDTRPWNAKSGWLTVPIIQIPLWLFLTGLFWNNVLMMYLAMHSVDVTVARAHGITLFHVKRYYELLHTTYDERKAEFDQELFGSQHSWFRFLLPLPIRADHTAAPTP